MAITNKITIDPEERAEIAARIDDALDVYRHETGKTFNEIAGELGCHPVTLQRWRKDGDLSSRKAEKFCAWAGVSYDWIAYGKGNSYDSYTGSHEAPAKTPIKRSDLWVAAAKNDVIGCVLDLTDDQLTIVENVMSRIANQDDDRSLQIAKLLPKIFALDLEDFGLVNAVIDKMPNLTEPDAMFIQTLLSKV